jgi:peptidase E
MRSIKTYFAFANSPEEAQDKANEFLKQFIVDEVISVNFIPFAVPQGFISYYIAITYKA